MCSIEGRDSQCYRWGMAPEQRVIARWLDRVRAKKGWSWNTWAKLAGVGAATTLSRAVKEDYGSVTKIETLHALARAAKVPSVLDFLDDEAFTLGALKPVLAELLQFAPKGRWTEQDVERFVEALAYGLGLSASDSASPASDHAYDVAARAAADRFRDRAAGA